MKDYKLIRTLRSLKPKDLKKLQLFIESPYFGINPETGRFLQSIIIRVDSSLASLPQIFRDSFDSDYNENRLRKKLHEALLVVEKFLASENFFKSDLKVAKGELDEVVERNIDDLISSSLKNLESNLDNFKQLTFEYYSYRFDLYNTYYDLAGFDRKIALKKNKGSAGFLQKADRILNEIFLSEKLRLAHLLNHDNYNANRNDKLTFIDDVLRIAKRTARQGSKPHFYVRLYELSSSSEILKEINDLHDFVSKKTHLFGSMELVYILFTLLNEAVRLSNKGHQGVSNTIFNLYKIGLDNGSFMINDELLPDTFRNIVVHACRIKEFDWSLRFIEEFKHKLNRKYRETAVAFNRARVYINLEDYENVIEQLRDVDFEDISYNLNTKLMLLVSYYELEEIDVLDSMIKSFNVFLRRKTAISQRRKESFQNFNRTLQDIVRVKERRDKVKLKTVRKKLESNMIAPNKSWLLDKAEELEKELGVKRESESPISTD